MGTISKRKRRSFLPASSQLRYAAAYILITAAALFLLNLYASTTIRSMTFHAQADSLESKAQLLSNALLQLDELSAGRAAQAVNSMEELHTTRTVVTDAAGVAVYDSLTTGNAEGKTLLFPELVTALEGSDVWNLNHAQGQPVTVSEETARLLRLALDYADKSDGALDVTIAPVSSLWDFKAADPAVPAAEELKRAAAHVNWKNLRLEGRTAQLLDKEMAVDLGAVAKGYIADRLEESLRGQGVTSALINLGGNIVVLGDKNGKAWQVGIQSPFDEEALAATLEVRDKTVVTSGTYERSFRKNGVLYHHILDPRTGEPVRNGLASVTILADGSMIADALSTACFVLGETKGMELIAATPEAEALFIREDGTELRSAGFPR